MKNEDLQILTTTIKGEFLQDIVDGKKTIEYRDIKPYWDEKLAKYTVPFWLRLINGMRAEAPEVIIEVVKVRKDRRKSKYRESGVYCLYLGAIKSKKNVKKSR